MSELESEVSEKIEDATAPSVEQEGATKAEPTPEAISAAEALKMEGNALLAEDKLMQAVGNYTAAIQLHPTAIYLSNRAFCYLKLEQFELAILDADLALTNYVKAYYRRGSAYMALALYKLAARDFRTVTKMQPKNKQAVAKLKASEKMKKKSSFAATLMTDADVPRANEANIDKIGEQVREG
eukprot:g17887.t1